MRRQLSMMTSTALLVASTAGVIGLVASSASAYEHNCGKYSGSNPTITYKKYSVSSNWSSQFDQGQYAWDTASGVPGTFVTAASSDDDPMLEVRDASYSDDWWARTSYTCPVPIFGTDWIGNETKHRYNNRTTGGLTSANKKYVVIHELGHSLGLDHVDMDSNCNPRRAVMSQGTAKFGCSGTPPWPDDQNGVIAKY